MSTMDPPSSQPQLSFSSLSLLPSSSSEQWDSLKKQARKYESQAYNKLTEYSRAAHAVNAATQHAIQAHGASSSSSSTINNSVTPGSTAAIALALGSSSSSSSVSANNASTSSSSSSHPLSSVDHSLHTVLEHDISDLLQKLSGVIEEMSGLMSSEASSSNPPNDTNAYTIQRYRAILQDYTLEYRKTKESLTAAKQRAELLLPSLSPSSSSSSLLSSSSSSSLRPRTDQLLREKTSLHTSLRLTDDLLNQAAESRDSLHTQHSMFHNIRGKVNTVRTRFPVVNTVIGKIERQKKKDVIVISAVLATCICFTFIYIVNKPAT